ncbi:hypothetical protein DF3PB_10112 [uncultured Defluviicoccus sp.]|uniref:Uncharacterized protein n=1 Tax=metagenome TaxID=256318 RepID=A0A380T865_9ZZZZ|nr:hypothetical protein DF3PB_10112 [uncultured Defluviicoccus sp.]
MLPDPSLASLEMGSSVTGFFRLKAACCRCGCAGEVMGSDEHGSVLLQSDSFIQVVSRSDARVRASVACRGCGSTQVHLEVQGTLEREVSPGRRDSGEHERQRFAQRSAG